MASWPRLAAREANRPGCAGGEQAWPRRRAAGALGGVTGVGEAIEASHFVLKTEHDECDKRRRGRVARGARWTTEERGGGLDSSDEF